MEWKDTTTYNHRQIDRKPITFSATCGPMSLTVTSGCSGYHDQWIAHSTPLFGARELKAKTLEQAKAEAVQLARDWLRAAEDGLGKVANDSR